MNWTAGTNGAGKREECLVAEKLPEGTPQERGRLRRTWRESWARRRSALSGGGLHCGLTWNQVMEVFGHMTLYAGILLAPAAKDIANEIFTNGKVRRRRSG